MRTTVPPSFSISFPTASFNFVSLSAGVSGSTMYITSYVLLAIFRPRYFRFAICDLRLLTLSRSQIENSVKLGHRPVDTISQDGSDRIGAHLPYLFNFRALILRKVLEHKILRVTHRMLRHDPDPQPDKIIALKAIDDRSKAVVSAVRTTRPEPNRAERQRQVVRNNDQPLNASIGFLQQAAHCFAAYGPERLRLSH